ASHGVDGLSDRRGRPRVKKKKPPSSGTKAPDQMSPEEMAEELAYLRAENAYLKKLKALAQSKRSTEEKKR
ncbi:hypothetical protein L861_00085, partial [Litchfieldella anticariensis FP35 = DSM 16096]